MTTALTSQYRVRQEADRLAFRNLGHIIRELGKHIPPEQCDAEVRELLEYGCATVMHVIPLSIPRIENEDHTKDIDFTPEGIRARRHAGYADTCRALERAPWRHEVNEMDGIIVHEEVM